LTDILLTIDQYNLYGKVAYPKSHRPDDVPVLYRLAAVSKGVFINPALTEPFGLTLIEAAASGLPIVATEDGGPRDITANCHNGYLIDPLDKQDITKTLLKVLSDANAWRELAQRGLKGVKRHYSWQAHTQAYVSALHTLLAVTRTTPPATLRRRPGLYHDRAIFTDLDQSLLGDAGPLADFLDLMKVYRKCTTFGIATGRRLDSALRIMKRYGIPQPDILITSLGTEICYAPRLTRDSAWAEHIDHLWKPRAIIRALTDLPGIQLQPKMERSRFKISYYIDPEQAPGLDEINSLLHQQELTANTFMSFGQFLDIVPVRASKGFALRWYADQWGIPLENILVAGGSGADEDMMRGNTMAVVVANRHHEELSGLEDFENIYFAREPFASGILEAVEHYNFLGNCELPST
ncbi:MAG: HAD family hydrolase, partial [Thiogranum sp.]